MSQVLPVVSSPALLFACGHCGVTLSVPAALAGVQGPCPGCGWTIQAPALPQSQRASAVVAPVASAVPTPSRESARGEPPRREPPRRERLDPATPMPPVDGPLGKWAFASLGALLGGATVFGSIWMWQLGRGPEHLSQPLGTAEQVDPTLDVLAEQRREAGREIAALLAAQQTVMRFLRSRTPAQAATWLDTPTAELELVAKVMVGSPAEQNVNLEKRRRLPDGAGYLSTWRVGGTASEGWAIQVNDCSGVPKIDWAALRSELETGPAEVATSTATPE